MRHFKLQFIREFRLAFAMLLFTTLVVAWFYNDDIKQYMHENQQITLANNVLHDYQQLASLVFREFAALSDKVLPGASGDLSEQGPRVAVLSEALAVVRESVAEEVAFRGSGDGAEELEQVIEIERLVEQLILSSELIGQALKQGRTGDARNELGMLRDSGFTDHFNTLIVATVEKQKVDSRNVGREATGITRYITESIPLLIGALVLITLFFTFVLLRELIHSVKALHQGALAFRDGDLSYRIPKLGEMEFQRLGEAFNAMAFQLSEHREQLRESITQLEATADERTRALQESNRKLALADANRRKLMANISHEFRTPLTVIRGEAEIALRGSDRTEMDYRESFQRIIDQAENTTRLVDDLLFIARADAGEPHLKLSSVLISGAIDSVCQEFSARAEKMDIKIERTRTAAGAVVQGDEGRLKQVFAILLENALRYSNPGDRVAIQVLQGSGNVEIIFKDEGIGLTEEESGQAFNRFYRSPAAIQKASGTGLGLPVAKAIVEAHNGSISLRGKPGKGATAIVVLPFGRQFGIIA